MRCDPLGGVQGKKMKSELSASYLSPSLEVAHPGAPLSGSMGRVFHQLQGSCWMLKQQQQPSVCWGWRGTTMGWGVGWVVGCQLNYKVPAGTWGTSYDVCCVLRGVRRAWDLQREDHGVRERGLTRDS